MKKIITVAIAVAAIAVVSAPEAGAQTYNGGYQFGAGSVASGFGQCHTGFGFSPFFARGIINQPVRPPYFAEFPPVYYSGIVRRPYGISPYAAPAGIAPVELSQVAQKPEPVAIKNPYVRKNNSQPASVTETEEKKAEATDNKSTKVTNPFFKSAPEVPGPIMHASFDVEN